MERLKISEKEKESLTQEYPFLKDETGFNFIDDIPDGWINVVKDFLPELKKRLIEINFLEDYKLLQVKEKFGFIRWYDNCTDDKIISLIQELEHKTEKTCIICGDKAKYISLGYISPYCGECKEHIRMKMKNSDLNKEFKELQD